MSNLYILLAGSALIMIGVFGLIEAVIRWRRRPVPQRVARPRRPEPVEEAAVSEIEETYVELSVVRDRETNPDGQPRQDIIKTLEVGDPVVLVAEPTDARGGDIRIVANAGTIGYVPPNRVSAISELLADSISSRSEVSYVARVDDVFSAWVTVAVRA